MVPQYLTLSKTLGAGLPLAAMLTTPEIEDIAAERGFLFYTTHASDPLPAAVGLKVIEIILRDRLTERAAQLGQRLKDGLQALQQRYDCIGDIRGRGLLLGLDLVKDRRTRTPDPELAQRVARECLELGMMTSVVRGGLRDIPHRAADDDHGRARSTSVWRSSTGRWPRSYTENIELFRAQCPVCGSGAVIAFETRL